MSAPRTEACSATGRAYFNSPVSCIHGNPQDRRLTLTLRESSSSFADATLPEARILSKRACIGRAKQGKYEGHILTLQQKFKLWMPVSCRFGAPLPATQIRTHLFLCKVLNALLHCLIKQLDIHITIHLQPGAHHRHGPTVCTTLGSRAAADPLTELPIPHLVFASQLRCSCGNLLGHACLVC